MTRISRNKFCRVCGASKFTKALDLVRRPHHMIMLAWNYAKTILANERAFRRSGGRFIIPFPRLRIV